MITPVIQAGSVLFGSQTTISSRFLYEDLDLSSVKSAFRRIALLTHPDCFHGSTESVQEINRSRFIEAHQAYERLIDFIRERDRKNTSKSSAEQQWSKASPNLKRKQAHQRTNTFYKQGPISFYYRGMMPQFRLRLGEFLYYSGVISWQLLIDSIVWQRTNRPRFGDIAGELQFLTHREVVFIINHKRFRELTGTAALRLRLLCQHEVNVILGYQKGLRKPIGLYFITHACMSSERLQKFIKELYRHNAMYANPFH